MFEGNKPQQKRSKGAGWKSVYDTLHTEILSLKLPPGHLLDETTLAERFDLSRSPVREALIRLAGDEMVVALPNRSTIVAPIDVGGFPKYVEALELAQRVNTRLAAELRAEEDLKKMEKCQRDFEAACAARDYLAMSGSNKDFHMAIATAGRNPHFCAFYERLLNQGRRMLHLHFDFLERSHDGYLLTGEHVEMIEAIRTRNVSLADELAHAHTRQFRDHFISFLKENYATSMPIEFTRAAE